MKVKMIYLLLIVGLSSIHAQPAQDEEGGKTDIKPVILGTRVPDEFWTKEYLFYVNGDTVRKTLEAYKGKMVVLDFWMTNCYKCFLHQKEINLFKGQYPDELAVIMVNSKRTKDGFEKIDQFIKTNAYFKSLGLDNFVSIIEDEYLEKLFLPSGYPSYYWINNIGIFQTLTFRNLLDPNYRAPFLD